MCTCDFVMSVLLLIGLLTESADQQDNGKKHVRFESLHVRKRRLLLKSESDVIQQRNTGSQEWNNSSIHECNLPC